MIDKMNSGENVKWPLKWYNNLLYYDTRSFFVSQSGLIPDLLKEYHATPAVGHFGQEKTYRRLAMDFFLGRNATICDRVCVQVYYLSTH